MRNYEGTVRVRLHEARGVMLDKGIATSTLTAEDTVKLVTAMVEGAKTHKVGICRWSLYIPDVSEKLPKAQAQIPVKAVEAALKDGAEATLKAGKWGSPTLILAAPRAAAAKSSKFIADIA